MVIYLCSNDISYTTGSGPELARWIYNTENL